MAARFFTNDLPDYKPGTHVAINNDKLAGLLKHSLQRILSNSAALRKPSVYTGSAGIAYAIHHVLRVPEAVEALRRQGADVEDLAQQSKLHLIEAGIRKAIIVYMWQHQILICIGLIFSMYNIFNF
jgi:hypothetical protein